MNRSLWEPTQPETKDGQLSLLSTAPRPVENEQYLRSQLLTYIGNKRSFLEPIGSAVEHVKARLKKEHLKTFDVFSGSGAVSRFLKAHSSTIVTNDIEDYATLVARCYLTNKSEIKLAELEESVEKLNANVDRQEMPTGFFRRLYSPVDDKDIKAEDRVFYTNENARRLDDYRRMIANEPSHLHDLLLGPLLSRASVHANTAGVFKGFYKNKETKIGQFGGTGADALSRITGKIVLDMPVFSDFECAHVPLQGDSNEIANTVGDVDLAYLDPPYNQHPYGSNYFMLNLLVRYEEPGEISKVSGIPKDWRRSAYNVKSNSLASFRSLVNDLDAKFLLVSFNDEGFITPDEMKETLSAMGNLSVFEKKYNAFRGSRNLSGRSTHVTEQLFLVEKH